MNDQAPAGRRIGILTYDYDPPIGGLGVLVRTYVWELRKLYPTDVFTVISPCRGADDRGSPFGFARYGKSGGCPLFSLTLLWSLHTLITKHRLQVLHVHSGSGGVFLLRKPRCKMVVTSHHTYRQEADLVYGRTIFKKLWKLFMALLESRTYHIADMVLCVSRDTAEEIISHYGVAPAKVRVIENPVRIQHLPELKTLTKSAKTILFVGRLEPRKGILLLLKAFQILRKTIPDARLRLIGFNMMGGQLRHIIVKRGLEDAITTLGYVHDPYRMRETAEAALLVVPSTLEGFGLVAAEAMMLGTAVVASDAPGLRTVVTNGKTGLTFPTNNAQACADQMASLLLDENLRKTLERNAATEAPERFDVMRRTQDQSSVYDELLK